MRRIKIISLYSLLLLTVACAIQVPPDGGPKDETPPELLSSEPENYSTNFHAKEIVLNFDEYITLNEIGKQLIISPPLKKTPEILVKKKSIIVKIEDTLLANTTYTMNFGQGIMDNNEGNKLDNFQYVFSTGSQLDSLFITGRLILADDLTREKGIIVSLYRSENDSAPLLERPLYFTTTNDSGEFRISNIAPGSYRLVGIKDNDANYLYQPGEEMIAFADKPVDAGDSLQLSMFKEPGPLKLLRSYSDFPGKSVLVFNANADTVNWEWLMDTVKAELYSIDYSDKNDSITIWYRNRELDSLSLLVKNVPASDTIAFRLFKKQPDVPTKRGQVFSIRTAPRQTIIQHIHLPFYLKSSVPLQSFDSSLITFMQDSVEVPISVSLTDSSRQLIQFKHAWMPKSSCTILILPGAFTNIFGEQNDSLTFRFSVQSDTYYGAAKIHFRPAENMQYVVQLVNGSTVARESVARGNMDVEWQYIDPGSYKLKIIHDTNGNGRWDTGDYFGKLQPEVIEFYPEPITIRSNWDVEINVNATIPGKGE